jgi:hypothetical protein
VEGLHLASNHVAQSKHSLIFLRCSRDLGILTLDRPFMVVGTSEEHIFKDPHLVNPSDLVEETDSFDVACK